MAAIDPPLAAGSLPENTPPNTEVEHNWPQRARRPGLLQRFFPRKLSKAEEAELSAERRESERLMMSRATLEAEADYYAHLIPDKLANLGICYKYKESEKHRGGDVKKVAIRKPYILREEAIYLRVDTRPEVAPVGVTIEHLENPTVLKDLGLVCGHKVLCKYNEDRGFYYIIERAAGVRGIPVHVKYDEILSWRPASADGLSLPFGIGESKRPVWKSLAQMQSLLVAGTTGGGKSNILNVLICTLLRYNSKRRLRLLLVDLKGGVEFSFYASIPHLLPIPLPGRKDDEPERSSAIIEDRQDVPAAFGWLVREGERRLAILKESHFKHIGEYNFRNPKGIIPHIVCIVDEWADVKLEPKLGKECEELLINIASRFRAAGIHMVVCTQTPNKDVINIRVKNVLPARLAFACPNVHSSMLIIGNGRAAGLEPRGRCIFDWGQTQLEIQAPLITNQTVDDTVASAIAGKWEDVEIAPHDVTDEEIYTWAVQENYGDLGVNEVYGHYRGRGMSRDYAVQFCKAAEGQTVAVGSSVYKVWAGTNRTPRRLISLQEDQTDDDEKPAEI